MTTLGSRRAKSARGRPRCSLVEFGLQLTRSSPVGVTAEVTMRLLGITILVLVLASSAPAARSVTAACSPSAAVLKSPRAGSLEVQVKAINDRGDAVGFAD